MQTPPEPPPPPPPSPRLGKRRRPGRRTALLLALIVLLVAALALRVVLLPRSGNNLAVATATNTPQPTASSAGSLPSFSVSPATTQPPATTSAPRTPAPPAPTSHPTAPPTANARPTIKSFTGPSSPPTCPSGVSTVMISLSWQTANDTGVNIGIDGPGAYNSSPYPPNGSTQLRFACDGSTHSYELETVGGTGTGATRTVVVHP